MDSAGPEQRPGAVADASSQQQPHTGQLQQQHHQQHAGALQQQQRQRTTALKQSASGAAEDFLDCEELNSDEEEDEGSSQEEGEEEEDTGSEEDQQQHHSGDELPLITQQAWTPDHTFKVLLVGDSGVGKTALCMRFVADKFEAQLPSTVGVDFAIKRMEVGDRNIKLTIWDTAGQERFRALTSTFYRGAVGIIFVYDVTRRETLASLSGSWMEELACYDPHPDVARMVVANKVDQHDQRQVTWQEGADFAQQHGCLFVETSAKHNIAVGVAFEELVLRILDTPALLAAVAAEEQKGSSVNLAAAQPPASGMAISCSC